MKAAISNIGEPREETVSQGGGGSTPLLSGGDERSEPESHFSFSSPRVTTSAGQEGWASGGSARRAPRRGPSSSEGHNYNQEKKSDKASVTRVMSGSQAKTAFALRVNCARMIELKGINSIGFGTFTVGDYHCKTHGKQLPRGKNKCPLCQGKMAFVQVYDAAEASRRIKSLYAGLLDDLFEMSVLVTERHQSSAIHFHALAALKGSPDIRTGFDFEAVRCRNYASVCPALKTIWKVLREKLPLYGFGRAELMPVRKTGNAVASYVSKYIEKNVLNRQPQDHRKKLVRYHGFNKTQLKPNEFEWNTPKARAWRQRARDTLDIIGVPLPDLAVTPPQHVVGAVGLSGGSIRAKCLDGSVAREVIGSKWAFQVNRLLESLQLATGDKLNTAYDERELLSRELQRLAGRVWCKSVENPVRLELLGETFTWREWHDWKASFPKAEAGGEANKK